MLEFAVEGGHTEAVRWLLDRGALLDGSPDAEHPPMGQAAWRGHVGIVRELVGRGARLTFPAGGSAIGAALHGSRHCHDPEGGPTMRPIDEVATERYSEVVRILLLAGAEVPDSIGDPGVRPETVIAGLGFRL